MSKQIGIYIHIPFCKRKCEYCDFISFSNVDNIQEQYINAVIDEIKNEANKEYIVDTIYIGGGTPSYIDCNYITRIIQTIKDNYSVEEAAEITIEVNPGTIDEEKIKKYKKAGINRVSVGLQSANNKLLKEIGRIHTYEEFLNSYEIIEKYFDNINVDLMLGLPNQTLEILEDSLKKMIDLKPKHISIYSLILEKNTPLYSKYKEGKILLPEDELERKMYWNVKKILEKSEYIHYEISNFSKKGYESKHNCNCWEQKEYLGFGVAAHSYINNKRYSNTENIETYLENYKQNRTINEIQNIEEKKKEYMLLRVKKNRRSYYSKI